MYIKKNKSVLIILMFLFIPAIAFADSYPPNLIIPTKYRFLLQDMAESSNPIVPEAVENIPVVKDVMSAPVQSISSADSFSPLNLAPPPSAKGMGRGYVETNFVVSFQEPGRNIDNRERLTARGLFNIHVAHGFS